jgi:7-keto-8-aminopelargonate synthetase-like enzyme
MSPTHDPLARLREAAAARADAGLRRSLHPRGPGPGPLTDFASNDYLGLATDPRLAEAAAAAARRWGTGATGSRLVTGTITLHSTLEAALATFLGAPAALVFSSGYLANLAVVTALARDLAQPAVPSAPATPDAPAVPTGPAAPDAPAAPPLDTPAPLDTPTALDTSAALERPRVLDTPAGTGSSVSPALLSPGPPIGPGASMAPVAAADPPLPVRGDRAAPGVLVVSDALNHASLVDACRLARARVQITPHQDVAAVERALARRAEPAALVITESAFSLGGRLTPLAALHEVTSAHGALLVIDEAHALGVVGDGGRGAAWQAGLAGRPDVVVTVSLSKALGGQGGAVAGPAEVIETLVNAGRGFIFDTGLAPPATAAALAALELLSASPWLATQARENAGALASVGRELGFSVTQPESAVVSIVLADPSLALAAQRICADHGVAAGCFRPPSVPPGGSCLRLAATASHTGDDIAAAGRALAAVRDHVRTGSSVGRKRE